MAATAMLAALAQETRLALFRLLAAHQAAGLSAGEIATRLNLPASTASFHLSAMERAGVLRATRQGRRVIYAIRTAAMRDLVAYLAAPPDAEAESPPRPLPPGGPGLQPAFNVLFLCTANAARSIMAEAILTRLGAGRFDAYSAGSAPAAAPNPAVIARLASLGHDTARLRSTGWDVFARPDAPRMDFVIALCDTLDNQAAPDFGPRALTAAWPLPDPAKFAGNPAEQATMLNELYASLRRRILAFVNLPFHALDRLSVQRHLDDLGTPVRA